MRAVVCVVLAALAVLAIACDDCSLSGSSKRTVAAPKLIVERGATCGSTVGDNGISSAIDTAATLSCRDNGGAGSTYNEWYYELPVTSHALIDCVTFGWDTLGGAGGTTDLIMNIYDGTVADYVAATAPLISSTTVTVSLDNSVAGSFVTYSLTAPSAPICTSTMLFQLISSDQRPSGNNVFPAYSADASGPTYLDAPDCGISTPTLVSDLGFANSHLMLEASGDVGGTCAGDPSTEPTSATPTVTHRTHTPTRTASRSHRTHTPSRTHTRSKSRR